MPVYPRTEFPWSKDAQRRPWIAECHRRELKCYFVVSAATEEDAQVILALHDCPHTGGPTRMGLMVSTTLLEECWEDLDEIMDTLMDSDLLEPEQIQRFRGEARGMAKLLARFMSPHITTADDIAREAKRRYEARKAEQPYETPGLGSLQTLPPPGDNKYKSTKAEKRTGSSAEKELSEQERLAIKTAADSGLFTHQQLAETYNVSLETVAKVAG